MDASAFSSLSAVARSYLAMWGAQFFIFEGAPFRLSLESKARRMACLFHTSGKMVPPQYSPSDTTSARSPLAVVQSALVEERGHSTRALPLVEERGHSTRALPSRARSAVPRDIFCSAPPLGCGIHSRLGCQTANNGTSWRLICASRARSRTDVRLGRASRACSPPICTILRRLIKLVCALLRFRECPRTIEVQRTTSSPQNHRKSLAQYSVVLFI